MAVKVTALRYFDGLAEEAAGARRRVRPAENDPAHSRRPPARIKDVVRRVYLETAIPSAYETTRTDASSIHRRNLTRSWWVDQRPRYDVWISEAVVLELAQGDWPGKAGALELVGPLRRVPITDEVVNVARRYVRERLVPADLQGDALHLAAACIYEFDFLLTWNIRPLANPTKLGHLTVINRRLGLLTPQVVTPEMLWVEDET